MATLGVSRRTLERYVEKKKIRRFKQSRYTLYLKIEVQGILAERAIHEEGKEDELQRKLTALSLRYPDEKKRARPQIQGDPTDNHTQT